MTDQFPEVRAALAKMTPLLDAMPAAFEPVIKRACDNLYERLMYEVQTYIKDNAEHNITAELNCAERQMRDYRATIDRQAAEIAKLASIVRGWHWLAVGPDEMGDYLHQRELIKASEPYASPALKSIYAEKGLIDE